MIASQGLGDSFTMHDDEGDAVGERPFFVGPLAKKLDARLQKFV
jgi:hypothetical protein